MFIDLQRKRDGVKKTSPFTIQIDSQIVAMIEELDDPSWQDEIRHLIEGTVRRRRKSQLIAQARKMHHILGEGPPAADCIRENRDTR